MSQVTHIVVPSAEAGDIVNLPFECPDTGELVVTADGAAVSSTYYTFTGDQQVTLQTGFPANTTARFERVTSVDTDSYEGVQSLTGYWDAQLDRDLHDRHRRKLQEINNTLDSLEIPDTFTDNSVRGYGVSGGGVVDDRASILAAFAESRVLYFPADTYKVSSEIDITAADAHLVLDPAVVFTTAALDMGALTTAIGANPVLAFEAFYKDVTSSYDLYEHVVGKSIVTKASTSEAVVVSLFANCEVVASGSHGFGANFGVYVTGPGTGIVCEIDSHVTHASGLGYALVIDSIGSYASQAAIVIQPNGPNSPFLTGLSFNNASGNNAITNNAIQFLNAGSAARFIFAHADMMFTSAVLDTNVFIIGPSVASFDSLLRVDASAVAAPKLSSAGSATNIGMLIQTKGTGDHQFLEGTGAVRLYLTGAGATYLKVTSGSGGVTLDADGSDTNADIIIHGKGTAGVKLQAGGGAVKIEIGDTGIGFFGAAEAAKPTGVAVSAAGIHAALVTLGLIAA